LTSPIASRVLARQLRSGPLRPILDRMVRSAAELADVPFMVLGLRYGDTYEFIATHGIPLSHYADRVPARLLSPKLFAREVEVPDLQQQAQFAALSIAPVAKYWRYGGNCPVRVGRPLSDDGVLSLCCADVKLRERDGKIIAILRQHAEMLSDFLWLSHQVQPHELISDPAMIVATVLQSAVSRFSLPVCIVDDQRRVVGQSEAFAAKVREFGGARPKPMLRLTGNWLNAAADEAIETGFAEVKPCLRIPLVSDSADQHYSDFFPFSFPDIGRFGILSIYSDAMMMAAPEGTPGPTIVARHAPPPPAPARPDQTESARPLWQFLDQTLVKGQRLNRRNKTSYVGVRRWRSAIKKHQIAALRALKLDLPDAMVNDMAAELADAVRAVYGSPDQCVVVGVRCGHSGPGCLSERLAKALAKILGIKAVDAFAPIDPIPGSSHPKKNAARPPLKLANPVTQPVILVDDVATTGDHLDEAARVLRRAAPSVWPVVWITP
jgi:hypothetical protein